MWLGSSLPNYEFERLLDEKTPVTSRLHNLFFGNRLRKHPPKMAWPTAPNAIPLETRVVTPRPTSLPDASGSPL